MAKKKTNTVKITLESAYNEFLSIFDKFSKVNFATILNTNKQNLHGRINNQSLLFVDEASILLEYLKQENKTDSNFYKELYNALNPEPEEDDFVNIPRRGEVSLSCGEGGIEVYSDGITETVRVPRKILSQYRVNIPRTEVVDACGNCMYPQIQHGDKLLVDTSQIDIVDGLIYAFNYEGEPMCKRLQKMGQDKLKAIPDNPQYEPIIIDQNTKFNLVGRVVGLMRSVL